MTPLCTVLGVAAKIVVAFFVLPIRVGSSCAILHGENCRKGFFPPLKMHVELSLPRLLQYASPVRNT